MSSNIEKFDPSTLMQGVKDRIKATFVSLIPDEQWDQMVQLEVDKFFREEIDIKSNYNSTRYSSFELLVNQSLEEECKKRLHEYMSGPEFESKWNGYGKATASESIKKAMIDNSGEILAGMFAGMFNQFAMQFRNSIAQRGF